MWKWLEAIFKMFSKKKKSPKLPPDLPDEIPEDSDYESIWKPMSDAKSGARKGNGVLIIGCEYRWEDFNDYPLVTANDKSCVREWRAGYANGNRMHMFLNKHGREYGKNILLIVPLKDGSHLQAMIKNGSKRQHFNPERVAR